MVKHCIYCSAEVDSNSVVDMCQRCMYQVWGEKMTKAIIENMEREKSSGNLELGQVSNSKVVEKKEKEEIDNSASHYSSVQEIEDLKIEDICQ